MASIGRGFTVVCALVAAPLLPGTGTAQQVLIVPNEAPYCGCSLELQHVATLGEADGPGAMLGEVKQVRRGPDGTFYVHAWTEHQIYRFNASGRPLPALGRRGQGPGETREITSFILSGDTLVVFDPRNARVSAFGPRDELVFEDRIHGFVLDAARVPGNGFVVNARYRGPDGSVRPLHYHDRHGRYVRSFGEPATTRSDTPDRWRRAVAASAGSVLSAFDNQYVIERWSLEGLLSQTIRRDLDWFQPYTVRTWGGPDEPIQPWIADIAVDERGFLRVAIVRAGPGWAEHLGVPRVNPVGETIYPIPAGTGLFETVIEIIDPTSGRLYASGTLTAEVWGFIDAEHVFSYDEASGVPRISAWRLGLVRTRP